MKDQATASPHVRRRIALPRIARTGAEPVARDCPNCGAAVARWFCPECGQRNAPRLVSVRRIVVEAIEDQLSVNGALPRTLGALLARPGHLTREYVAERIRRYVPPFRLYLLCSVLFFVAFPLSPDVQVVRAQMERQMAKADSMQAAAVAEGRGAEFRTVNLGLDTVNASPWARPLQRHMQRQQDRLNAMRPGESLRGLFTAAVGHLPKVVFLVLPLFAVLLKALYLRRRRMYVEHFVFALHVHSFAFLLGTVLLFTRGLHPWVLPAAVGAGLLYLFAALKTVYGQGVVRTVLKFAALLFGYALLQTGAMTVLILAALLTV